MTDWAMGQRASCSCLLLGILLVSVPLACSSSSQPTGSGGVVGGGGLTSNGGQPASGGGGVSSTGGHGGSGGITSSGGIPGSGGASLPDAAIGLDAPDAPIGIGGSAVGGTTSRGGTTGSDGITNSGGATGTDGATSIGGTTGIGGSFAVDAFADDGGPGGTVDAVTVLCNGTSCTGVCKVTRYGGGVGGNGSLPPTTYWCVPIPAACAAQPTCDCLCKNICGSYFCSCYSSPANTIECDQGA